MDIEPHKEPTEHISSVVHLGGEKQHHNEPNAYPAYDAGRLHFEGIELAERHNENSCVSRIEEVPGMVIWDREGEKPRIPPYYVVREGELLNLLSNTCPTRNRDRIR